MNDPCPRIVVDIGNSGLKAAVVAGSSHVDSSHVDSADRQAKLRSLVSPIRKNWVRPFDSDQSHEQATELGQPSEKDQLKKEYREEDPSDGIFEELKLDSEVAYHWMISGVHRAATERLVQRIQRERSRDKIQRITFEDVPMRLLVETPEKLGIDRLLAGWGAWKMNDCRGPVIAIQAGTAVTVDLVTADGEFAGGAIMPGVPLALRLLAAGTDLLPEVDAPHDFSDLKIPGQNTAQAMRLGASASVLGGAIWMIEQYRRRGGSDLLAVVSGGDGIAMEAYLPQPRLLVEHLVLRALASLPISLERSSAGE